MVTACHILVEDNPVIIYASRNGTPDRVLPILNPFLETFCQEREISGEDQDTPECLVAQIVVRFGYEICEDDFSNLRVGIKYKSQVEYLYWVSSKYKVDVWVPEKGYITHPEQGLKGCRQLSAVHS